MKHIYIFIFDLILMNVEAQVGVNTAKPLSTFEVHKSSLSTLAEGIIPPRITADSLKLKDNLYGPAQDGAFLYITSPATSQTSKRMMQITSSGYYIFDAKYAHADRSKGIWKKMFSDTNAFAAKSSSKLSFSSFGKSALKANFQTIKFNSALNTETGSEFIDDDQYVVPQTGLYVINYSLIFVEITGKKIAASQRPKVAITRSAANAAANFLVTNYFEGYSLDEGKGNSIFLSSQTSINHIYNLNEGEKLNFGVVTNGLDLSSLGEIEAEISIYKIR